MMDLAASLHEILQRPRDRLGDIFYTIFHEQYPEVQSYFVGVNLRVQATMLMNALQIVVAHRNCRHAATAEYLKILGHRHFERGIPADLYPKFCDALLASLAKFHAADWNPALADAWRQALDQAVQAMLAGYVPGPMTY